MIKERGSAKHIITQDSSQIFSLHGAVKHIRASREGYLWWNRRYTVVELKSTQQNEQIIIDSEKYLTERGALSAARERMTGHVESAARIQKYRSTNF